MAKLRRVAMFSGPCPVRTLEASSRKAVSRTKWSRFSITHCDLTIFAIRSGEPQDDTGGAGVPRAVGSKPIRRTP